MKLFAKQINKIISKLRPRNSIFLAFHVCLKFIIPIGRAHLKFDFRNHQDIWWKISKIDYYELCPGLGTGLQDKGVSEQSFLAYKSIF